MIDYLRSLIESGLAGLEAGIAERSGPLLAGGPDTVTQQTLDMLGPILPPQSHDPHAVVRNASYILSRGAADPNHPHTIAHLQCPPMAEAIAVDVAVNTMNASLDSWDQAPSATVLEKALCHTINQITYPQESEPDSIITTGGSESNLIALLISRELLGADVTVFTGENSHHTIYRSCWQIGIKPPVIVPTIDGAIHGQALEELLANHHGPALVVATAGTTDQGIIDPLPQIHHICRKYQARMHVDAAYGGMLLVSDQHKHLIEGIDYADSITLDFHKLSFQPVAASSLVVKKKTDLTPLTVQADYLNAVDDSEAGIPDVLDRSIKTTRRLDALKVIASWQSLGQQGLAERIDTCISTAQKLAERIDASGLFERPLPTIGISTVLFRPKNHSRYEEITEIRRQLLFTGKAVLGRAKLADGTVWLKATVLNPFTTDAHVDELIQLIHQAELSLPPTTTS